MSTEFPVTPPKRKGAQKGEALWLMSFSDMVLTLLCFFLLLISTMKPNKDKFKNVRNGMETQHSEAKADSAAAIAGKVQKLLKDQKMADSVAMVNDADGLHMEFKDGLLFESGATLLKSRNLATIQAVLGVIAGIDRSYHIHIEGHTDDLPLQGSQGLGSNWELSAARGFTIMRHFHTLGVPESRIAVTAYAHTRPKIPYQGLRGQALARARAANRRVVIWLE